MAIENEGNNEEIQETPTTGDDVEQPLTIEEWKEQEQQIFLLLVSELVNCTPAVWNKVCCEVAKKITPDGVNAYPIYLSSEGKTEPAQPNGELVGYCHQHCEFYKKHPTNRTWERLRIIASTDGDNWNFEKTLSFAGEPSVCSQLFEDICKEMYE